MWVQVPPSAQRKRLAEREFFVINLSYPYPAFVFLILSETEEPFQILDLSPRIYANLHELFSDLRKFTEK
jgi:hypothetical protein